MSTTEKQMWYRVSTYFDMGKIVPREVVKVTDKTVTFLHPHHRAGQPALERRENRDAEYHAWRPSEWEAVAFARDLLTRRRDNLSSRLREAESALAAFNALHPESHTNAEKEG